MILCVHGFGQTKLADVEVGVICWFVVAQVSVPERQPLEPSRADYNGSFCALGMLEPPQGLK